MLKKLLMLWLLPAAAFGAERMTVDQAVATAVAGHASVQNARLETEKDEDSLRAQKTRRLPSLTFEALGSETLNRLSITLEEGSLGNFPATGPIPDKDTRLDVARTFNTVAMTRLTQPITQLHKINLGVRMREASVSADKEQERAARQAIAREVKRAYFDVLAAESYAAAAQEMATAYEEVEREMAVRVAQKAALDADRLDATARLIAARAAVLTATNTLASAKDKLNYLVGTEVEVVKTETVNSQLSTANTDNRPDIREAALRVEQAKLDTRLKAADRYPDVSLTVTHIAPIGVDVIPQNITTAGVMVSYEPFTWGRRNAEVAQKQRAAQQAENALRDKRAAAAVEIAAQRRKVDEAAAQVAVRRAEADATRERLRVVKARFQEKAARQDELFNAGAALTQAAAREQEAVSAYWTARADYQKAIGEE